MFDGELKTTKIQEVRLSAVRAEAALEAAQDALAFSGAILRGLSIRPAAIGVDLVLRLAGLEDAAAERLAECLARRPGVGPVRLEHCWVRP